MPKKSKKRRKASNGMGNIRKTPNGRFEARYTAVVNPFTSEKRVKSKCFDTEQEAREFLVEINRQSTNGSYILPSNMTLERWLISYLELYAFNLKDSTRKSYEDRARLHIIPAIGNVKLCDLTPVTVQSFINSLYKEKGDRKELSPKTVKCIHGVLHAALGRAVSLNYIHKNPADKCVLKKINRPDIDPLTDTQIIEFLKRAKEDRFYPIYFICLFTGLRQGEVLGLTWDCVDFENKTITINKQLIRKRKLRYSKVENDDNKKYELGPVKNDHIRTLIVGDEVMSTLKERFEEQQREKQIAQNLWFETFPGLVFENEFGGHITHTTVRKHFKKIVTNIGLPEERFHNMRHNYTAAAYEGCHDLTAVQKSLGHATPDFTMRVYDHITQTRNTANAQGIDKHIKHLKNQMQ